MKNAVELSHVKGRPEGGVPNKCFALDESAESEPTSVDVDFIVGSVRYHYGFTHNREVFLTEWLYSFPFGRRQTLFQRKSPKEIDFGRTLKGRNRIIADLMRPNSLYISAAIQNGHEELTRIASFFNKLKFSSSVSVPADKFSSPTVVDDRTIKALREVGTGIVGYRQIERPPPPMSAVNFEKELEKFLSKIAEVTFEKKTDISKKLELAHRNSAGENIYFDVQDESAGTRRLLYIFDLVFRAIDQGGAIVIDELDASLHTQACEAVLGLFSSKTINLHGAQLIATTHDTNLMRSKLLRRDQIWFTEKDSMGATHLFPLSDVKIRHGDNIEKGYLQGRFGAIPFSGSIENLLSRIEE